MLNPFQHQSQGFQSLIRICLSCKNTTHLSQVHTLLVTTGLLYHSEEPIVWNALIQTYNRLQNPKYSLILFAQMLKNQIRPANFTFPPLIKASSCSSKPAGRAIHGLTIKSGLCCDDFIHSCLIRFYASFGETNNARQLFVEMHDPDLVSHNAMLDAYCKNGELASACKLFDQMAQRNVVSWTTMINGYAQNGSCREGLTFFHSMMELGLRPHEATLVTVLSACSWLGATNEGKSIHGYVIRKGILITPFLGTSLIDMYSKCGSLSLSVRVFGGIEEKQLCNWNAMISALATHGHGNEALQTFNDMLETGFVPNGITFIGVLSACSRAGYVESGLKYFGSMHREFNIVPEPEHYGCMIDLLGRAGFLEEATDFLKTIPVGAEGSAWGALLGACKLHGEEELGKSVGSRVLQLEPERCGRYVVLSQIYSLFGRHNEAEHLREVMSQRGVKKLTGYSWVNTSSIL